jgi:4-hydroxybenzoate polyprenyltransferase
MPSLIAWLKLLRIPNHATAVADVLAGWLVVTGAREIAPLPAEFWCVAVSSICLYGAGMVLNDVYDLEVDREERPERPLPSGLLRPASAAAFGGCLLVAGVAAAIAAAVISGHPAVAAVGVLLAAAVWLYDRHAKPTAAGPAVMGSCRALNWLLGMTAAGGPVATHQWLIPVGMGLYVAGITLFSRDEAGEPKPGRLLLATLVMLVGLATAGLQTWLMARSAGGGAWLAAGRLQPWLALWAILSGSILLRNVLAIVDPSPERVRIAVGNAIMSIITLDAVLVLAACGEAWAIVVLMLLAVFLFGRRIVPPT